MAPTYRKRYKKRRTCSVKRRILWSVYSKSTQELEVRKVRIGRRCSKVAKLIRGKYKPTFTPHVDCGDNVIIINASKVVFTGKKETDKVYTRYTGYPGGQRFNTPAELRKREGGVEKIIRHAVKGMLPKGPLGRSLLNNLYVYEGTEHKHEAQKPKTIDINQYK